ncbi:hypothetical protein X798_02562 [Onchocerca flexuosa]|uniref:Uncharacterized protein n=1 Tax=Onchocerca flexuosa TaxID=387005 RepID=A0A238BZL2_9BILA|nr:hypothetical protein X798_02562 [Onchocerca flexuosa]
MQYARYVVMAMRSYIMVSWLVMDAKDSSDVRLLESIDMCADSAITASLINQYGRVRYATTLSAIFIAIKHHYSNILFTSKQN